MMLHREITGAVSTFNLQQKSPAKYAGLTHNPAIGDYANAFNTASPIWDVDTLVVPSSKMSAVRKP